jgi:magnesium-transporting ATPase (P-type)
MVILSVVFAELLRAYSSRSLRVSVFQMGFFSNRIMQYSCLTSVTLTVMVATIPGVQDIFNLKDLDGRAWGYVIGVAFIPFTVDELTKCVYRAIGFGKRPLANLQRHAATAGASASASESAPDPSGTRRTNSSANKYNSLN